MRLTTAALTMLFALSSMALVSSQTLPSGLKPVPKAVGASCLAGFHADPQTYDNLDPSAHYNCYSPNISCASNLSVWWQEPPGVSAQQTFRYSCKTVQVGPAAAYTATCAAGFSVVNLRLSQSTDPNVKYICTSAPAACPTVFNINQGDPDWYGYKGGFFMYKCTKSS